MRMPTRWTLVFFLACFAVSVARADDVNTVPDTDDTADLVDDVASSDDDDSATVADAARRRTSAKGKGGKGKPTKAKAKRAAGRSKESSGADSEEGWIIQKDKDGNYIKVPRKQTFRFEGDVSAQANRPSQTVLGQRPVYRATTLIPERNSFRREFLDAAGYAGGGRSE